MFLITNTISETRDLTEVELSNQTQLSTVMFSSSPTYPGHMVIDEKYPVRFQTFLRIEHIAYHGIG